MDNERSSRHRDRGGDNDGRKRSRRSRSRSVSVDNGNSYRHRNGDSRYKHKPRDHSSKRHKKDNRREHNYSSESSTDSSRKSDNNKKRSSKRRHRKEKKKKKHKKKKDRKHSTNKYSRHRHSRSRSPSNSPPAVVSAPAAPPGAHGLASALTHLFNVYPAMSSLDEGGIPLLFIQLSRGTEYNLSQMPDRNLARLLEVVFESLRIHGMELLDNGAWKWGNSPKGGSGGDDLALLRLVRALLNGVGATMDSVEKYEHDEMQKLKHLQEQEKAKEEQCMEYEILAKEAALKNAKKVQENEKDIRHRKRVERMTSQLLDRFDPKDSSLSESSLANELQGICDVLVEGESINLDGIENTKLRATLAELFKLIGLQLVEMDEEDEDETEGEGDDSNTNEKTDEKAMGYALPDTNTRDTVATNLNEVLRVCRFRSSGGSEGAPTSWSSNQTIVVDDKKYAREESSSDDEDGPAPLGTMAAAKAAKRKRVPQQNDKATAGGIKEGGREEWMMVPGEHDFLKGISKSTKSRTFKNEKQRGQSIGGGAAASAEPINPQVLEEVNAIQKAYEQSRGPSLFDAHRQKVQETKEQQKGKEEWKWSRDKNLDDGRRVDKNALHLVLGGASTELKSKFQGSLGRN